MSDEYLLDDNQLILDQTPSVFGDSSRSKRTRMGSTDAQGNRLSNMPGEERPSLMSVTPYDDEADQLIDKVNLIVDKANALKKKTTAKKVVNDKSYENKLDKLKDEQIDIMQTNRVLRNEGKQFDRQNFVKINQDKPGKYKPALRGAAFSNKMLAKKSNTMKFRGRM